MEPSEDATPSVEPAPTVAYPRGLERPGTVEQLRALRDGYFGLTVLSLATAAWIVGGITLFDHMDLGHIGLFAIFLEFMFFGTTGILAAFVSFPINKKISIGMGWTPTTNVLLSICYAFSGCMCFGMPVFVVLYILTSRRLGEFGVRYTPFVGYRKKEINRVIAQMEENA